MMTTLRSRAVTVAALLGLLVGLAFFHGASKPVTLHSRLAAANGAWTVYHHDDGHTGYDPTQPKVASVSAGWTSATLDGEQYAEPLIYNGIVYAATLNNTVYALNQVNGSVVWSTHLRAPQTTGWTCGGFQQGILGTPVIDVAGGRIYVATLDSSSVYRVEGLNLGTGVPELSTVITTPAPSFDWHIQQERGALGLGNGFVYVPFGGRDGDCGSYHGWIFAVPTNGTAVANFYETPGIGASFWGAGGVVVDDATGNVFEASGNGTGTGCAANADGTATFENDAVARFSPTLAHLDAFYPQDWKNNWCGNDQDLGSAGPMLISSNLLFQSGKWGTGFLLNPNSLGGMDGQLFPTPKPATYVEAPVCYGNNSDATFGGFAYAAPYVFVECNGHGVVGLNTDTSTPSFTPCPASCPAADLQMGGTTTFGPPIVAGGAVWAIDTTSGTGLYAFDTTTGAQIFHSASFGSHHFVTPAEAGGQVFAPAGNVVKSFNMNFFCTGTPISTSYFNWYDKASVGMVSDNIHILNTGASVSSGCVSVTGYPALPWSAGAGQETYVSLPAGTIGGPVTVTVNSGPAVQASQRVQFEQSFNEVWAQTAAQASTTSYLNWFDKASAGMLNDNIHVLNPGATSATVTISLPGASSLHLTVGAGAEGYASFPQGTIGGPILISSTQPVLASQRVQYNASFNEVWAQPASLAATTSYLNWYDKASAGMYNDNVHLLNPGGSAASVTVGLPGAASQTVSVPAGGETYVNFPQGTIGGPITVSSATAVLASQRVQYYSTFNEVWAESAAQALTSSHVNWYDKASAGMNNDNIHLLNPGGSAAMVTVSLPGSAQTVSVPAGGETYVTFPYGTIGGPVTITSATAVLAAQRVQYYSSFNEIWSA
jgi:putative pyrroloquinoline-quinone binding quinoprotein